MLQDLLHAQHLHITPLFLTLVIDGWVVDPLPDYCNCYNITCYNMITTSPNNSVFSVLHSYLLQELLQLPYIFTNTEADDQVVFLWSIKSRDNGSKL